jgi:hypothetical protein
LAITARQSSKSFISLFSSLSVPRASRRLIDLLHIKNSSYAHVLGKRTSELQQ